MDRNYESKGYKYVAVEQLKKVVYELLCANKLPIEQAKIVSECFIEADLCGISTHGIAILPTHLDKLNAGGYNLEPRFNRIREGGAFAVIDSDNAMGVVSAVHCMKYAMDCCKEMGIFTVLSRNSNTYGPAFYYPLLAAKEGLIGITFCNSPAAMTAWGGKEKLLGTNPLAIAIPSRKEDTVIFDMATSKVAKSKINQARLNNEKIPLGWALDERGFPTTDPIDAIKGSILPMAEHKGYGLALIIDILAGVLSGAAFLNDVGKFYSENNQCMNVGQTFIAIDPKLVLGDEYYNIMDKYIEKIHSSKGIAGEKVLLPGDNKAQNRKDSMTKGIKLEKITIDNLNKYLKERGLTQL